MMAAEDFVQWSDLDLDDLLGEYTEDDIVSEVEEMSDFALESDDDMIQPEEHTHVHPEPQQSEKKKKEKRKTEKSKPKSAVKSIFVCPLCPKKYASISGFRGHMIRKHDRGDIRAQDNISCDNDNEKESTKENTAPKMSDDQVTGIIENAVTKAQEHIVNCPKNNSEFSRHGRHIIAAAKAVDGSRLAGTLTPHLSPIIFSLCSANFSTSALESTWTKLHSLKTNTQLTQVLCEELPADIPSPKMFVQTVLAKTFNLAIVQAKELLSENESVSKGEMKLTDNDQSVLFYVSGYMAKKSQKYAPDAPLTTKTTPQNFLAKPSKWTEKLTRGGLKIPSDSFYLLVREFEIIMRQSYNQRKLHSQSLLKAVHMENMMQSFMVRHYWTALGGHPESSLEYIAKLFLTVRGFALTRQFRNERSAAMKVKSLRKSLKKKSTPK